MASDDYAILVGISRYPGLQDLAGPETDARNMHAWLKSATGGNVPEANIALLISSNYSAMGNGDPHQAQPITAHVNEAFERLIDRGYQNNGKVGRRLYIFLAGHGFAPDLDEVALLMANARKWAMGHHIPGRLYANWFRMAAFFEEIILLMDCCRINHQRSPKNLPPWDPYSQMDTAVVRHFYSFATQWSYKAYGFLAPTGVEGRFTHMLLKGLQGGARDKDGRITATSLKSFIRECFERLPSPQYGRYQEPSFDYDQDIILVEQVQPLQAHVHISFPGIANGVQAEIIGGDLQPVAHHVIQDDTWDIYLPRGLYRVQTPTGRFTVFEVPAEGALDVTC
jgi:hypothetical protein